MGLALRSLGPYTLTCLRKRGIQVNTYVAAAILGLIEGLTEFLPVSSTGHLILFVDLLGFQGPPGKTFEVMIQLGAILALIILYFYKLWTTLIGLPFDPAARRFTMSVLVAFLPAAVLGAALHGYIKSVLFSPLVVACALIAGGFVIIIVEETQRRVRFKEADSIPIGRSLLIGFGQTLALIPGVSRSGATIITGLLLGLERKAAAEFSFFLSIPTMTGAFVYDAFKNRHVLDFSHWGVISVGFGVAFISALLVVKPFLAVVSRVGFAPFAYYRIALGTFVLTLAYLSGTLQG
jgi:undecaprenyl-diphosphatase